MLKFAEKPAKRPTVIARAQPQMDRAKLRAEINTRFSRTLDYLAR